MISVHGKVTDFQLWDKVLSDEELLQVRAILPPLYYLPCLSQTTDCRAFPRGNVIDWETTNWFLNSSRGTVSLPTTLDLRSSTLGLTYAT